MISWRRRREQKAEAPETRGGTSTLDRYRKRGKTISFRDCPQVEREPGVANGAWLFKGTPIRLGSILCELAEGKNLDRAAAEYHGMVEPETMKAVLYHMAQQLDTAGD